VVEECAISNHDVSRQASIPAGVASLESILCTEELCRRPSRPPDYAKENRALVALARALADSPHTILQTLAETILEITQSDSAGISLLTTSDGGRRFYWPAIAGLWKPHIGGGTPRDFGPCGDVLDRNCTLLFRHLERRYTYFLPVTPLVEEGLLVPFYVGGKTVGTIWAIMHNDRRKFDAEDERLMGTLGKSASSAYQTVTSIDDLKFQMAEREKAEEALLELTNELKTGVRVRTEELEERRQALRRSQFYLSEGQRLTHTGSWALDPAGFFDYWSPELFQIFGVDPAQGPPTLAQYLARIHPKDREFMVGTIERMLAEKSGCDVNKRILRPDGALRLIRCVGVPVFDKGSFQGFVGTAMDITEQEELTQQLRRSEAYLAQAQSLSHTGSFGWNVSSGEIFWSEETYRIVGFDRATKPTLELVLGRIHPEDVAAVRQTIERAAKQAMDLDFEHRFAMPDGSVKHVHVVGRATKQPDGSLEYIGAATDVTATKMAFQEIQKLKDQLQRENVMLREEVVAASMFEEIVGTSAALRAVLLRVSKVAPTDSTVLITGETGTGKELVARAIHKRSTRSKQPFVSVNCAAIPPTLIASELFGHERGAFTGAFQRRLGRFELARGGTIFLDEVGELPPETQIALLRVLQENEFERVGGTQPIRADVRLIAATNRDLKTAITAGSFRSDLFYRLNVFPIEMPSLRARKEDIPLLAEYFIHRYASKMGKKMSGISKQTLASFQAYSWPGNIRELQNVIERSLVISETETFAVDESWLARHRLETETPMQPLANRLATDETELIETALAETRGRVSGPSGAAARLGMPASTLESKIRVLKINKHQFKTA